jgi:hypothetical protein
MLNGNVAMVIILKFCNVVCSQKFIYKNKISQVFNIFIQCKNKPHIKIPYSNKNNLFIHYTKINVKKYKFISLSCVKIWH